MNYDTINWIERLFLILLAVVMKRLLYLLVIAICWSCNDNAGTEKHQGKRDNIINVRDKVKEIVIEDVMINSWPLLYMMGDYLIIADYKSTGELIHIFDKNSFCYLASTAFRGQGPYDIANIGHIGVDEDNRKFYVTDHGKQQIFSYDLDSVLADKSYKPIVKIKINREQFPDRYQYINDTLSIGIIIEPTGTGDYKQSVAKWNLNTEKIELMKYEHPSIKKKRITFAVSIEHSVIIECYIYHDLMTICSLNGDLKYNIYGKNWGDHTLNRIHHYGKVILCNDRIFAAYSGGDNNTDEYNPTKFLVFDINGNYIQTIETKYQIIDFCYDKDNNRIIMSLNDEIQFAYLDLDEIVK